MKFFEGAKVKIKSMDIQGTVQRVLPFDRYSVRIRRPLTRNGQPLLSYNGGQRFTVETHNIAEIDMDLSRSYNDGTANSDRGLTTLEAMGVDPETVTRVFIKKVKEIHDITANWVCEVCMGTGHMRVPQTLADAHAVSVQQGYGWNPSVKDLQGKPLGTVSHYGNSFTWQNTCLVTCAGGCKPLKHIRGMNPKLSAFGKHETRATEVTVFYPQWTPGVKFDSRFRAGSSVHEQCHLCSKAIPSGRLVAVEGRDASHNAHGMYIGIDCAKKFTGYNIEFEPLDGTTDIIVKIA